MSNFQPFTANAEDPFNASYSAMNLPNADDFGLQNLPFFSPEDAQAKGSAKPQSAKDPKKRQRTPDTAPRGDSSELHQVIGLLQDLLTRITQKWQADNVRWQQTCQMMQYLKQELEKLSSGQLQESKARKQGLKTMAKAAHDLVVQLEKNGS